MHFRHLFLCLSMFSYALVAEEPQTQPPKPIQQSSFENAERTSINDQSITIGDSTLQYDVRAGSLKVRSKDGHDAADVSFIAYFGKSDSNMSSRPVAFCFNGGPGSSSVWLHMGFLGPKTIDLSDPKTSYKDNIHTLLPTCDLVFIDPVSTGFSAALSEENEKTFHGVEEDLYSVADFIRLFLTKFNRWNSPKFIIGESYGTFRAVGLAHLLQDHFFIQVDGLILISMVCDLQALSDTPTEDLACITVLPTIAAIAQHHHRLSPPFDQMPTNQLIAAATTFSIEEYAPALLQGSNLSIDRREYIKKRLYEFTSIPESKLDELDLRLTSGLFIDEFLHKDRLIIGRFDGRTTAFRVPNELAACSSTMGSNYPDPSFYSMVGKFTSALQSYLQKDLLIVRPEPYVIITDAVHPWDWSTKCCQTAGLGYLSFIQDFRLAMSKNPSLKVFVAAGYYDLATPYFSQEYSLSHLFLPARLQQNIIFRGYKGGHMMYMDATCRDQLTKDLSLFITSQ